MRRNILFGAVLILALVLGLPHPASARQDRAPKQLVLMEEINGTLSEQSPEMSYTVDLFTGQMFSVQVWPTSGDLQVDVVVSNPEGAQLAQSTVVDQETGLATAEGIIADQDGSYAVTVRRMGQTAGDFSLLLLPGYASLTVWDHFDGTGDYGLRWPEFLQPPPMEFTAQTLNGQYKIELVETQYYTAIYSLDILQMDDFYIQADVQLEGQPEGVGFFLRMVPVESEGDTLTIYSTYNMYINYEEGKWVFLVRIEGADWIIISPKQPSPLIDKNDLNPTIGVLVQGYTFTLFINGQMVGQVTDTSETIPSGDFGLLVRAGDNVPAAASFDNLVITTPQDTGTTSLTEGILNESGETVGPFNMGEKVERDVTSDREGFSSLPAFEG